MALGIDSVVGRTSQVGSHQPGAKSKDSNVAAAEPRAVDTPRVKCKSDRAQCAGNLDETWTAGLKKKGRKILRDRSRPKDIC
ncbi:uncharacterized protein N7459_004198 [Penicillium hispanicum]|uniref:uncharacterized protein n=1 Tax=Penicillium hispanicum TaxID=1080232 RepID=UPI002540CAE4|nr:uncharacterized protein N7459_004198 [Penicillium hispanicum]KAJ5584398.1 hypothetical protein N7459_004198 [Penicillium hispanicum]